MKSILSFLFFLLLVSLGCGEKAEKPKAQESNGSKEIADVPNQDSEADSLYVLTPSGLSLRKEDNLSSEKLATMPLGSPVILLDAPAATDMAIENIEGAMLEVQYEGQRGFAFSGYLSPIRLLKEGESVEDYIADLKKTYPDISYESKANDPDFHEGTTDTFVLPVSQWHEAYYIVSAMYGIPKSLGFPNPEGAAKTVTEDPKKPADVWDSFIATEREGNSLKKIEYSHRAEGFGYGVDMVRKSPNSFLVSYLGFVD
ncbi:SH3 domain-containing protein [Maribacter sp. 2308TA10-17]|uniref:SH3 domain-containing protein n=1 Tax=Maribacter sp. 2308TA10-17 TaxID=3386276 RepID=UPI0039BD1199